MSEEANGPSTRPEAGREHLFGWIPHLATTDEIRQALEKAFDYRGDVTLTLKNGDRIEGYVFDRRSQGKGLDQCLVRVIPKERKTKIAIRYSEISRLEFSGKDTAEGKSFEAWIRKYREGKARGETNISIEPETLE